MSTDDPTLTEVLASFGIRHEPRDGFRRRLYRGDELLGDYDATEGWALVARLRAETRKDQP
jgi:hypothetical protein